MALMVWGPVQPNSLNTPKSGIAMLHALEADTNSGCCLFTLAAAAAATGCSN